MAFRQSASGNYVRSATAIASRNMTICCWAKLATDRNNYSSIVEQWGGSYTNMNALITDSDGTSLAIWPSATPTSMFSMTANAWYFLAWVATSAGALTGYYSPAGGGALSSVSADSVPSFNSSNLYLLWDSDSEWFNGAIEAVKVWQAELTAAELAWEQWSMKPHRTANLIRWWPLWGVGTGDIADYSGNGVNLTKNGTAATQEPGPPYGYGFPAGMAA